MEAAYRRGNELSKVAHKDVSIDSRTDLAADELSAAGVDEVLSRKFVATLPPPLELTAQCSDAERTAFFAGWLDAASGSSKYREDIEAAEQLTMNL